jgi:hypothetical protein
VELGGRISKAVCNELAAHVFWTQWLAGEPYYFRGLIRSIPEFDIVIFLRGHFNK